MAGWVEMFLLRRGINNRIGWTGLPVDYAARLWLAAALGAGVGWGIRFVLPAWHPIVVAVVVLGAYGVVYLGLAVLMRVPEVMSVLRRAPRPR